MKIVTIIGARPQFIKAAVISRQIKKYKNIQEIIIHTGQHYDENMSKIFFEELNIPFPHYNLGIGSGKHGEQTGKMMVQIEDVLLKENPEWVIVYGDTNSTIAAVLVASKLHIKVAHIEAGLRSFNRKMPEEINRIVTDHISDVLFAPTKTAVDLLKKEGIEKNVIFSGDVMYDSVLFYNNIFSEEMPKINNLKLPPKFYLSTIHRPQNTDNIEKLKEIFEAFSVLDFPVILPLHPRTKNIISDENISIENTIIIEPLGYKQLMGLLKRCEKVLTDSGGLQKEAYFLKKQCITLRTETEWTETLSDNWNVIVGSNKEKILKAINFKVGKNHKNYFGDGNSAKIIVDRLLQ